ncbi:MAG: DUF4340 domain-containing protein [Bacteroidota bacterium]
MQEKKNKFQFALLIVLLAATTFTFWKINRADSPEVNKNIFKPNDLKAVSKITLESAKGTVELAFTSRWNVNQQYDADRNLMDVLFATLQQAEPKRKVAQVLRDSIANELKKQGIKISMFAGEQLVKTFYAGGNARKSHAFFMTPGGEVYLMTIPGYRVYVSGILELDENGWRDKHVFGFNWRNFKGMIAEFPARPADNFEVVMGPAGFGIKGLEAVDTARFNTYLDEVSLLTVDEYVDPGTMTDSLSKTQPFMVITVSDIADKQYRLKLYTADKKMEVRALIQETQGAVFHPEKIRNLLRSRAFFEKK